MLVTRILSAVVLIPLVLTGLYLSPLTTALLTGIAAAIGTYEFYTMASNSPYQFRPLVVPGLALALAFSLAGYLKRPELMLLAIALLAVYALLTLWLRHRIGLGLETARSGLRANWAITMFGPLYAGLPLGLVALIRSRYDSSPVSFWWILLALLGTWGTDTGAYFVGRALGRHKLAPKISPNKTIEGAIGGVVLGTIGVALVGVLGLELEVYWSIGLGLGLSIGSILGDLFESWLKRRFDTKDSGKIIPGHGGLLDRIDSFLVVSLLVFGFIAFYQ